MVSSPPLHTYRVYAAIAFSLPPSFFLFPSPLSLSLSLPVSSSLSLLLSLLLWDSMLMS